MEIESTNQIECIELLSAAIMDGASKIRLSGLSGGGKSTLLEATEAMIRMGGYQLVEGYFLSHCDYSSGSTILSHTVGTKVDKSIFSPEVEIVLKSMGRQEILSFIESFPLIGRLLSNDEIADLSLGIPLIAKELMLPGITKEIAIEILTGYLKACFPKTKKEDLDKKALPYLGFSLPPYVIEAYGNRLKRKPKGIYDYLPLIIDNFKDGDTPLFAAPESPGIYNKMLEPSNKLVMVTIFVPCLSKEQYALLQGEFAFTGENIWERGEYDLDLGRLFKFNVLTRKLAIVSRDVNKKVHLKEEGDVNAIWDEEEYRKLLIEGNLQPFVDAEDPSFYFRAHDHDHMPDTPVRFGWAVESFLQLHGIAYFVNNHIIGRCYSFNPETKHIIYQGKSRDFKDVN